MTPITNIQRAAWAKAAVLGYSVAKDETRFLYDEEESVFGDMLADLMHYAAQAGFDFDDHIARAGMHYEAELADEGAVS
jgi:hypothetical protein